MLISLKSMLTTNTMLKIISLILGFSFWFVLSRSYTTTHTYTIPVAVYGSTKNYSINAPEYIQVTLQGKRNELTTLNTAQLAVHVNGTQLHEGENNVIISCASLFLPEHIKLVHYSPAPSIITVTKHEQKAVATPEKSTERSVNATA